MHHLDDGIKALYKLDPGNVHVMGNIANPGSVYIIFTEAPDDVSSFVAT